MVYKKISRLLIKYKSIWDNIDNKKKFTLFSFSICILRSSLISSETTMPPASAIAFQFKLK